MDRQYPSRSVSSESGRPWRTRRSTLAESFSTCLLLVFFLAGPSSAVTLEELQGDNQLTPKRFAKYFSNFNYQFHEEVQPPEQFLFTKAGDCDDYAILADTILRPKGFDTRLISVRMPGLVAHVVCYVGQEKAYLDFNNRAYFNKLERSGPALRDIAAKVAKSFGANWTSATEFTYLGGSMKRLVATVAKTDPPTDQPMPPLTPKIKIDF